MLHNRGVKPDLINGTLDVKSARSMDAALRIPRDTLQGFSLLLDTIRTLGAGERSDRRLLASADNGDVYIGGRKSGRLPWPDGDFSDTREWIINLWISIFAPNYIWEIEFTLTWNRKEDLIGIGERRTSGLFRD
jgi:hypothetical protein